MLFVKTHTSHILANVQKGEWKMHIKLLTGFSSGKRGMMNKGKLSCFMLFLLYLKTILPK